MKNYRVNAERTQSTSFDIQAEDLEEARELARMEVENIGDHEWHTHEVDVEVSQDGN